MFPKVVGITLLIAGVAGMLFAAGLSGLGDPVGRARPWDLPMAWYGGLGAVIVGLIVLYAKKAGYLSIPLAAICAAVILGSAPAYASTAVSIPIGDWISSALVDLASVLVAAASWAVAKWAPPVVRTYLTEQLLSRAADYGIAAVSGAVKGKVLTVEVANDVLAEAMSYAVKHAPGTAKWLGGTLKDKLIARLGAAGVLPEDAHAGNLTG